MGRRARLRSAAAAGAPSPTACGCATGFISRCSGTRTPIRFSPGTGRAASGLAKIDAAHDPTLRPGDIVASGDNQKAALLAAANKQARSTVTEKPAALRTKAKPADPEAEEKPED